MNELKKEVFKSVKEFIHDLMDILKKAETTHTIDAMEINMSQATLNEKINNHFNEFEMRKNRSKGLFGK